MTADFTEARCDIYPKGEDHASATIPCTFGQRQGNVTITRSDGVVHNPVDDPDNWTAPYTTADYDATTRFRCGYVNSEKMDSCPAGILRMEDGQASIVITSPSAKQFTINFMKDHVNSAAGEVAAHKVADTWIVIINNKERYEVPLAALEGR